MAPQSVLKAFNLTLQFPFFLFSGLSFRFLRPSFGQSFSLSHREPLLDDQVTELLLFVSGLEAENSHGMALCNSIFNQFVFHLRGKFEQSEGVGNRGSIFSDSGGNFLLTDLKLLYQTLEPLGLLNRVEVFPLEVFNRV